MIIELGKEYEVVESHKTFEAGETFKTLEAIEMEGTDEKLIVILREDLKADTVNISDLQELQLNELVEVWNPEFAPIKEIDRAMGLFNVHYHFRSSFSGMYLDDTVIVAAKQGDYEDARKQANKKAESLNRLNIKIGTVGKVNVDGYEIVLRKRAEE